MTMTMEKEIKIMKAILSMGHDRIQYQYSKDEVNHVVSEAVSMYLEQLQKELNAEYEVSQEVFDEPLKTPTNGEVLKTLYPNQFSDDGIAMVLLNREGFVVGHVNKIWWNTPYETNKEV